MLALLSDGANEAQLGSNVWVPRVVSRIAYMRVEQLGSRCASSISCADHSEVAQYSA